VSGFEVKVRRASWEKGIWVDEKTGLPRLVGKAAWMARENRLNRSVTNRDQIRGEKPCGSEGR